MTPEKLTEEQLRERLSSNDLVIIDYYCLPQEFQDFELDDTLAGEIDTGEAAGRWLSEGQSCPEDKSRW